MEKKPCSCSATALMTKQVSSRRLRLWLDLLTDLAASLSRMRRHAGFSLALGGAPSFHVLEGGSSRPGALLFGGLLSLIAVWAFLDEPPAIPTTRLGPINAPGATTQTMGGGAKLDAPERQRVIDAAIANLKRYYIDPGVGEKTADALLAHSNSGDYDVVMDAAAFAGLLTRQMRDVSHDGHLTMVYNLVKTLERPPGPPPPEILADYRKEMERKNCTFEKVEVLRHNIGYLKLNSFPYPPICQSTAVAAMASLNHADAIIFDLRDNGGGSAEMVALIAGYLFDHRTHLNDMYNRAANTTQEFWTASPVPGNSLADKPAYVLTSARSFSGAEEFSYDLKMLRRATLVGETTAGAAHGGRFHWIDDHFGLVVPETRSINPISKKDWEGTGVEPDVKVNAADALATAVKLAESQSRKK